MRLLIGFLFVFNVLFCVSCANNELGKVEETEDSNDETVDEFVQIEEETVDSSDDELSDDLSDEALAESEVSEAESEETTDEDEQQTEITEESFMNSVAGRYAHYDIVAYYSDMGLMGVFKNLIISYGFTTFEQEDGKLKITDRFCHSEQISNQDFTTTVPDALTQAIIPDSTFMEIKQDNEGNFYLYRPQTPTLLGIEYEDPYNTPLPESIKPDDPRLVDADDDGKPGVTVFIDMFNKTEQLYIARREIFAFEAYLKETGRIEGVVHDNSEQLIIDATSFLLKNQTGEWLQFRGENGDDYSLSPILLVPVDESYDCEKLMQERDTFFPPNPAVWAD
ncbi:MAG TPA: hypothetical protein VLJ60_12685 [bacterium]|nr:hypothetical protein [bacterium]